MSSLNKISKSFQIVEVREIREFTIKNKKEEIVIYDKRILDNYIDKKFMDQYNKILALMEDDDSSSNTDIVRDESEKLRNILYNKYKLYINDAKVKKYDKMIDDLLEKVPEKKGRGR